MREGRKEDAMTEPRICYYFLKLDVGRTLLLLVIFFAILMFFHLRALQSEGIIGRILGTAGSVVRCFIFAVILLCAANAVTARINPAGYGICYGVRASYSYVPNVSVLCTEDGYTKDEYGVPLFTSLPEYAEWFVENHPEKAFPEQDYKYTDDELARMACDYYNARSTETATGCYITPGEGVWVTLTLENDDGVILETYEIDRDELEGRNRGGDYIYLKG